MNLAFEWDPDKAAANLAKHGIGFHEARTVFADRGLHDQEDRGSGELRWNVTGLSSSNRLLTVCFTERGDRIRIISARLASPAERRDYERSRRFR